MIRARAKGFVDLPPREAKIRHAIRRMWQRKGFLLSRPEYDGLVDVVRHAQPATRANHDCEAHIIEFRGKEVVAIFDPYNDCIVTFLPTLAWLDGRVTR